VIDVGIVPPKFESPHAGTGAPSGSGYTKIFSNEKAFTAVKADGSITAWGDSNFGGTIPTSITASPHISTN
jgi:hypothetical protein